MNETLFYKLVNKKAVPCLSHEFVEFMKDNNPERVVAYTDLGEVQISTVFLGIDHAIGLMGDPILFETMVFGGEMDGYIKRYSTYEEAGIGHDEIWRKLQEEGRC